MRKLGWGAVALLVLGIACGRPDPKQDQGARVAVPPFLAGPLGASFKEAALPVKAAPLRPYARAEDLEVLLLSSGSTAYEGYVVRATSLPLLRPWLAPLAANAAAWREDIRESLAVAHRGFFEALPLCSDGPVLLIRSGVPGQKDPAGASGGLADLESALEGRAKGGRGALRLRTTLPSAVLFLGLAWSDAGEAGGGSSLPEVSAVRAAAFLQRWLAAPPVAPEEAGELLARGEAEGLFCWASEADSLFAKAGGEKGPLRVSPLPHRGPWAVAPFCGWVLVRPKGNGHGSDLQALCKRQEILQERLSREGFAPVGKRPGRPSSPGEAALEATRLCGMAFTAAELQILEEAVADAVEAGIAPEQALRRARARLAAERRGPP